MLHKYGWEQAAYCIAGLLAAVSFFSIGVEIVVTDTRWAALVSPLLISLVGTYVIRRWIEEVPTQGMFRLRTQSKAFVIGDGFVLPLASFFVTIGWSHGNFVGTAYGESWVRWLCIVAGFVVAIGFRVFDYPRYQVTMNTRLAFNSPTKLWHDFVVYPVLVGVMLWAGVSQLIEARSVWTWLTVVSIAAWVLLGFVDMKYPPNPEDQHPAWNSKEFRAA